MENKLARPVFVYIVGPIEGHYKIGFSNDPVKRVRSFRLPIPPAIFMTFTCRCHRLLEGDLHRHFAGCRSRGEWFKLTDADLDSIPAIVKEKDREAHRWT